VSFEVLRFLGFFGVKKKERKLTCSLFFSHSFPAYAYGMIIALTMGFLWQFWASSKGEF